MGKKRRRDESVDCFEIYEHLPVIEPLKPMTKAQESYLNAIEQNIVTFGIGCAGTGKSYIAVGYACQLLMNKQINKIVLTRPAIECGEKFGFMPGELHEKLSPYYQPIKDIVYKRVGQGHGDFFFKRKMIEFRPLAFMRGSTFDNAFVILDEAQNTTKAQMKMFLTRIGNDCKVVIDGDIAQSDLKIESGLHDAVNRLSAVRHIGMVEFSADDVVRSGIVKDILRAYQ